MPNKSVSPNDANSTSDNANQLDKKAFVRNLLFDVETASDSQQPKFLSDNEFYTIIGQLISSESASDNPKPITRLKQLFDSNQLHDSALSAPLTPLCQNLIDLLDRLFDALVINSGLATDIKSQINRLNIPFLVLLSDNPKLLLKKQHPSKQLLNDMVSVGLLWDENDAKSDQILLQITNTVEQLLALSQTPKQIQESFGTIAEHFNQFANSVVKRAEIFEKRIREAEEGQARAQSAKLLTTHMLNQILYKDSIPEFVQTMLSAAWQHVIFLEYLKSEDAENNNALFIAKALLVSLQPLESIDETEKFLELQPTLEEKLRAGLEKSSYSFAETSAFLEELDQHHNELLISARSAIEKGPKEEILRLKPVTSPFELESSEPSLADGEQPELDSMNVNQWVEFAFNALPNSSLPEQNDNFSASTRGHKDRVASEKLIKMLTPGRWVTLSIEEQSTRCKLSTYIESTDKYVFVSGSGSKLAEYDGETLIDAFRAKKIKLHEKTPLFERAFKSVLNELYEQHQVELTETHLKQAQIQEDRFSEQEDKTIIINTNTDSEESISGDIVSESNKPQSSETTKSLSTESTEQETKKAETENLEADDLTMENLSRLAVGSWLEIKVGYKMKKCRLAARIASTGKLIFTDRSGVKVKECFDTELAALYQKGELKLDEENTLFDKAFSSVISSMRDLKSDKIS